MKQFRKAGVIELKDLLELLRVQRHNFLNHLQVISGLLQLKKYDRVTDYIAQIGNEYNQATLVGRLEVPEIVTAILISDHAAEKQGITIDKKISTGLEKGIIEAASSAQLLKEIMYFLIDMTVNAGVQEGIIELKIEEELGDYCFTAVVSCDSDNDFTTDIKALKNKAVAINGELDCSVENNLTVISLKVPVCG